MTGPIEAPPAPPPAPLPSALPSAPPPAPGSYFTRIVTGVLLAIIAASVLAVGLAEMASGKVDPGSIGAMVFLAGLTALGIGLGISGVRAGREAREAMAQALEHQLLELAARQGGALTVPLVSLHLSVSIERARAMLDALAVKGGAEVRVGDDATLIYDVPGLGARPLTRAAKPRLRAASDRASSGGARRADDADEVDEADGAAAEELLASARKHPARRQE